VIEDLDGGDSGPSRAPLVRGISVALMLGTVIGWVALQSPVLRGPYATPDPRGGVVFSPRPSAQAPSMTILDAAALQLSIPITTTLSPDGCFRIQQVRTAVAFVGDHPVTLTRALNSPPPGAAPYTVVTFNGPALMWRTCAPDAVPAWRFAP
jgi:hypothetical protein